MAESTSSSTENTPLLKEDNSLSTNYLAVDQQNDDNVLSIYNETDVLFIVKDDQQKDTAKDRIGHMLHTTKWNITILLMLACDVFIVVLDLFVQLDEKSNSEKPHTPNHDMFVSIVHNLGYVSDVFLCIFTTEVFLHLYCFGINYLFDSWINFIDSVTVLITFITTLIITFYSANDTAQGFVDILIILRFWRIFCLVESVVNATQLEANLRFKEVLIDLNAEVRILENRKNCYAEKLVELGYDLSQLENDYLFPKFDDVRQRKIEKDGTTSNMINEIVLNVSDNSKKAKKS